MSEEEKKAIDYLKNDVVYWLDKGKDFVVIDIGENEKLHSILNLIDEQKKEIEEKSTIIMAGAEKVKQLEKEIEELKLDLEEMTKSYNHMKENWVHKLALNSYIRKDKIREKIKELESLSKNITMQPSIYNYEIDLLEELLEEN